MTLEANKQLVLEYVDAFNRGDMQRMRHLFSPDALIYGVLGLGGLAGCAVVRLISLGITEFI
jgi:Putative lumazine-binding